MNGDCAGCKKRRAEQLAPPITVRVVQEPPSVLRGALVGLATSVGMIAGLKIVEPLWRRDREVPV